VLTIFSVFFPLFVSLLLFNNYATHTVYSNARDMAGNSFSQLYSIFSGNFEAIRRNMLPLQIDTNTRLLLQSFDTISTLDQVKTKSHVNTLLAFVENKNIWNMRLSVFVNNASTFIIDEQYFFPVAAISHNQWYTKLLTQPYKNMWVYTPPSSSTLLPVEDESGTFSYIVRVCDPERYNETSAVVSLRFSEIDVRDTLRQSLPMMDGAYVFLADDENIIITESGGRAASEVLPPLADIPGRQFSTTTWSALTWEGVRYHVQARAFKNNPWRLIMLVPYSDTFRTLLNDRQWLTLLVLALACGFCIFGISMRFSKSVSRRIGLVSERMSSLKDGVLQPLPAPVECDELGTLIESYNYLTEELSMLITAQNLAADSQKKAELTALQSQINPHFLYNTLEMINYFAYERKPEEVERIVVLLSRFYKLCLNKGNETTELIREMELTETYLNVQNIRYRGQIKFVVDIPHELYQYRLPHIILQPIVENAVKHGVLNRKEQTGTITISARDRGDDLIITVSDDGAGMSGERLRQISEGLQLANDMSVAGSHYGLKNIHERLVRYYGPGYGLSFQSEPGRGTAVTVRLSKAAGLHEGEYAWAKKEKNPN
jgi:two-component system sensor histidine kinase YesM